MGRLIERYTDLLNEDVETAALLDGLGAVFEILSRDIIAYQGAAFEKTRGEVYRALSTTASRGRNHHAVQNIFASGGDGKALYSNAMAWFRAGGSLRPNKGVDTDQEKYKQLFIRASTLTLATAWSLHEASKAECYGWTEATNAHIDKRTLGGGLRGLKTSSKHTGTGGSTGDGLVDGPIFHLVENLDKGLLVTAYVLSGIRLDHAGNANNPLEHWLLIIGHERTVYGYKFAFWDPDAWTSRRRDILPILEHGFGLLHFVAAAAVPTHPGGASGLPDHFTTSGRFSTEANGGGILVDEEGYHVDAADGSHPYLAQHRYQVGSLKVFSTGSS